MDEIFLKNIWYFGLPSGALKSGQVVHRQISGKPLVFGRTQSGQPFALQDNCPHRGIPLSDGRILGEEIECCYHGWRFSIDGACAEIPALVQSDRVDLSKIQVPPYSIKEQQGIIWVWLGDGDGSETPIPEVPDVGQMQPKIVHELEFPVNIDHAVVGLIDPAHTPHIHESWFWRRPDHRQDKEKSFKPSELGFEMSAHRASNNSSIYKLIGGEPEVQISFALPGVRIESIRAGRNFYCGMTACTPISENTTNTSHLMWWSMGWADILKPVVKGFAKVFLKQDQSAFIRQSKGLAWDPPLRLSGQPDQQAKWYYQIKNEWARSVSQGQAFRNPLKEATLRWRT
ncbi:MAG: aromatic ring-hydroxylating dioxygenase subunit alpha [Rhodospirillaceae bacterium]